MMRVNPLSCIYSSLECYFDKIAIKIYSSSKVLGTSVLLSCCLSHTLYNFFISYWPFDDWGHAIWSRTAYWETWMTKIALASSSWKGALIISMFHYFVPGKNNLDIFIFSLRPSYRWLFSTWKSLFLRRQGSLTIVTSSPSHITHPNPFNKTSFAAYKPIQIKLDHVPFWALNKWVSAKWHAL